MNYLPYSGFAGNYFVDKKLRVNYYDSTVPLYEHYIDYTGLDTETMFLSLSYLPDETDRILRLSFENEYSSAHNVCWFILKKSNSALV